MVHVLEPAVALWEAPPGAISELVDYGTVEHRLGVGEVSSTESEDRLAVEVVQRDEIDISAEPISITRSLAFVSVAGVWLRVDQARELVRFLTTAADVIENRVPATP